VISLICIRQE